MTEAILEAVPVDPMAAIRLGVLEKLGHPKNVIKVDVKRIYANSYRVNVWTKTEDGLTVAGKITHSEVVKYE